MARKSTCKDCGKKLNSDEKYTYGGKTYCKECYENQTKIHEQYDNLIKTICIYFNIDAPSGLILKQIKDYTNNFNYTYSGINYTLWYITQIKSKRLELKYGIALVKYEYMNAENYYIEQQNISKSADNVTLKPKKIIKIDDINTKISCPKLFNLDDLIGDEDK